MPFAFVLPTTSAFSLDSAYACPTHPSLLRNATTYRGVVRDTLKKHKRLPPEAQAASLGLVVSSLEDYLPYLVVMSQNQNQNQANDNPNQFGVRLISVSSPPPLPAWRPSLAGSRIPGRQPARVPVRSLDHEAAFVLATLGHARTLQARAVLQPLQAATSVAPVGPQQRAAAIAAATRHLMDAASVLTYAAKRMELSATGDTPPDIHPALLRAHAGLALAEATLLAVRKDDPYPAVMAQHRSELDREWMYKAPDIPRVRAHLFARLCLAAAEHVGRSAASASSALPSSFSVSASSSPYIHYLDDLCRTARARACRFFAIDAELAGQTGTALAWLHAALQELGDSSTAIDGTTATTAATASSSRKSLLARIKKDRSEKHEDRRLARGVGWGADAGRLDETRVVEMLDAKWTKQNDTINTQPIPPYGPLLAQMPSGRDVHTVKPFDPPVLDPAVLEAMRVPPDPLDSNASGPGLADADSSSDDDQSASASSRDGRARRSYY